MKDGAEGDSDVRGASSIEECKIGDWEKLGEQAMQGHCGELEDRGRKSCS